MYGWIGRITCRGRWLVVNGFPAARVTLLSPGLTRPAPPARPGDPSIHILPHAVEEPHRCADRCWDRWRAEGLQRVLGAYKASCLAWQ
jgi:hypothetical protein